MANIKSAQKKMRKDVRRKSDNDSKRKAIDDIFIQIRKGVKSKKEEFISGAYSKIDKTAKTNAIHKNKAARLKSRVSRLLKSKK